MEVSILGESPCRIKNTQYTYYYAKNYVLSLNISKEKI